MKYILRFGGRTLPRKNVLLELRTGTGENVPVRTTSLLLYTFSDWMYEIKNSMFALGVANFIHLTPTEQKNELARPTATCAHDVISCLRRPYTISDFGLCQRAGPPPCRM